MTPETRSTRDSPQRYTDCISVKCESTEFVAGAAATLSKEAKQQYLIDEIKNLVADCEDFIGLVPGPGGVPEVVVSPNLKREKWKIIGEAHATFSEYLSFHRPCEKDKSCGLPSQYVKAPKQAPTPDSQNLGGSISIPIQRPLKRHRSRSNATASRSASNPRSRHGGPSSRTLESSASQIRVDDHRQLTEWYKDAFLRLQQVACRLVAKVWIKKIHPKKQSTHPYNGQMPRNAIKDSNRTRPPYWPIDVTHKEPDHIGRDERTRLLVHLIMNTPQPVVTNPSAGPSSQQSVYARDLLECLEPKRGEKELTEERWELIQQIISTREMQERYAEGEIDGDTLIFLRDYKDDDGSGLRVIDSDDDESEHDDMVPGVSSDSSEVIGDGRDPTPGSSSRTSPTIRTNTNIPLPISRSRSSADTVVFPGRRIARCWSRPSFKAGQSSATLSIRAGPNLAPELPIDMRRALPHEDAGMLSLAAMHHQGPQDMFGRIESHSDTTDLMRVATNGATSGVNLQMPPWSGMLSDMGPGPPPEAYSIAPTMTPNSLKYSYLGQNTLDMAGELQSRMDHTLFGPQYQDFIDGTHRALPLRGAEPHHPTMLPTQDVNMEMMASHYY